jgi:hypothetical protein
MRSMFRIGGLAVALCGGAVVLRLPSFVRCGLLVAECVTGRRVGEFVCTQDRAVGN